MIAAKERRERKEILKGIVTLLSLWSFAAKQPQPTKPMKDIMRLADTVRQTSYDIHVYHGHGHLEKVYENALANRLRKLGLDVKQQYSLQVYDEDGTLIGEYFADLLIDKRLIVELKAARSIADEHVAQTLGYLKAARIEHGLLINFGSYKFQIKKFVLSDSVRRPVGTRSANFLTGFFAFSAFFRG